MHVSNILNDDWSSYDHKKRSQGEDVIYFDCRESWEVDYLVKIIEKLYPEYDETIIRAAIARCCKMAGAPRSRESFVACVASKLWF